MGDFNKAYEVLLQNEGRYSNHKNDRGGETYKGISRRFYPHWSGWKRIDAAKLKADFPEALESDGHLTRAVKRFYKKYYWAHIQGDKIRHELAMKLFDSAVNIGVRRGIRQFQEALNLLNRNRKNYADLTVDGIFGQKTSVALRLLLQQDGSDEHLFNLLKILRGEHYVGIMRRDETQEEFARGWLRRVLYT